MKGSPKVSVAQCTQANVNLCNEKDIPIHEKLSEILQRLGRMELAINLDKKPLVHHKMGPLQMKLSSYCENMIFDGFHKPLEKFSGKLYDISHSRTFDSDKKDAGWWYTFAVFFVNLYSVIERVCFARGYHADYKENPRPYPLEIVKICISIILICEYCFRVSIVRRKFAYMKRLENIGDLLSILPGIVEYVSMFYFKRILKVGTVGPNQDMGWYFTGMFIAFRSLRLYIVLRFETVAHPRVHVILRSIYLSTAQLGLIIFFLTMITSLVAGGLIFQSEESELFAEGIDAIWLGFITITTVGYGDVVARTLFGRLMSSVVAMIGLIVVSTVVMVVAKTYEQCEEDTNKCEHIVQEHLEAKGLNCKDMDSMTIDELFHMVDRREFMKHFFQCLQDENEMLHLRLSTVMTSEIFRRSLSRASKSAKPFGSRMVRTMKNQRNYSTSHATDPAFDDDILREDIIENDDNLEFS